MVEITQKKSPNLLLGKVNSRFALEAENLEQCHFPKGSLGTHTHTHKNHFGIPIQNVHVLCSTYFILYKASPSPPPNELATSQLNDNLDTTLLNLLICAASETNEWKTTFVFRCLILVDRRNLENE